MYLWDPKDIPETQKSETILLLETRVSLTASSLTLQREGLKLHIWKRKGRISFLLLILEAEGLPEVASKRAAPKISLYISLSGTNPTTSMAQWPCSRGVPRGVTEVLQGSWSSVRGAHSSVVAPALLAFTENDC